MLSVLIRNFLKKNNRNSLCLILQSKVNIHFEKTCEVNYLDHFRKPYEELKNSMSMSEVNKHLIKEMGIEPGYTVKRKSRDHLLPLLPKVQEELPHRTMKDSHISASIPLAKDIALQNRYVSVHGRVRIGRLLEDLDAFAVAVSYKYLYIPKRAPEDNSPYVIVTVLVDQISFNTNVLPKYQQNIYISGYVSWVGKTSLEITALLEQEDNGKMEVITKAVFLMAARNATNTGSAFVNPLIPQNDAEAESIKGGEERKKRRIINDKNSILKKLPSEEEMNIVHNLFQKTIDLKDPTIYKPCLPKNCVWMNDAVYHNMFSGYPENRNMYDKVFGGYMMREALSLSWYGARLFSHLNYPRLLHICDIVFKNPISIGSIITMHAHVVYTEKNYMQVVVFADSYVSIEHISMNSIIFYFTFSLKNVVKSLVPYSYSDAMQYIEGRRHFQAVMGLNSHKNEEDQNQN